MREDGSNPKTEAGISHYFSDNLIMTQQETLGQIAMEIIKSGKSISRKALCSKLLVLLEGAENDEQEKHYQQLIGMLFSR
ncbi:MAG: putative two-component-system connector protein YcgZ [Candidatus Erwinia impunctatus]|nr:putative two-component-system connector protein YcgZ [Culicoides impunctatus]